MASVATAEDAAAAKAASLRSDTPKINAAVKNVFAMLLAQTHAGTASPPTSPSRFGGVAAGSSSECQDASI